MFAVPVRGRQRPCTQMVRELNALSDNQYESLQTAFNDVSGRITDVLERKSLVTDGPLLLPLTDIRLGDMPQVGGKMANLGEVSANVGLAVPDGFAVTVNAYHAFMEYNGLRDEISRRIQSADMDSMDDLFSLSAALQQCILNAPLPPQLEQAIEEAVAGMVERCGSELRLALRSSAVGEDALGVTFAGQYRSELNVLPEEACEVWKEIVASKYAVTAMSYRFQRGIPDEAAAHECGRAQHGAGAGPAVWPTAATPWPALAGKGTGDAQCRSRAAPGCGGRGRHAGRVRLQSSESAGTA